MYNTFADFTIPQLKKNEFYLALRRNIFLKNAVTMSSTKRFLRHVFLISKYISWNKLHFSSGNTREKSLIAPKRRNRRIVRTHFRHRQQLLPPLTQTNRYFCAISHLLKKRIFSKRSTPSASALKRVVSVAKTPLSTGINTAAGIFFSTGNFNVISGYPAEAYKYELQSFCNEKTANAAANACISQ